ncbi:MAG: hypothetical protein HPY65_18170 [Syntrophaceae bacterium]|nr:hypothetical protein [Syntrophaceae bacterium]
MKIKCPRCGYKGELINSKCQICDLHIEPSSPTKSKKYYIISVFVFALLAIVITYLKLNNYVLIKKDIVLSKESKHITSNIQKNDNPDVVAKTDQAKGLAKDIEKKSLCVSLLREKISMADEKKRLLEIIFKLREEEIINMQDIVRKNWPESQIQKALRDNRDIFEERRRKYELEEKILNEKRYRNADELKLNNCEQTRN